MLIGSFPLDRLLASRGRSFESSSGGLNHLSFHLANGYHRPATPDPDAFFDLFGCEPFVRLSLRL